MPFATLTGWLGIQQDDRWEGYDGQRQELIDYIDNENITNVYWLAGDMHTCYIGDIDNNPSGGVGSRSKEICVTSGNTNPAAGILGLGVNQFEWKSGEPPSPSLAEGVT